MTANIHEKTGIPYGIISANSLDPDVVYDLMYGSQAKNLSWEEYHAEVIREVNRRADEIEESVDEGLPFATWGAEVDAKFRELGYRNRLQFVERETEAELEAYQRDEETIEGELDGVHYMTSWLGGALNFFIFESPVIFAGRQCSPCVPNACDLNSDGDYEGYGVPADWLAQEYQA